MIYLDNAATSWPKPPGVTAAMVRCIEAAGGNPGRAGHRLAVEAGRIVYSARAAVAELFHVVDPLRITFGQNVTEALNLALFGFLNPGDHVVTSSIEHNAMMRPLRALEREGVELSVVHCSPHGRLDPAEIVRRLRPNTTLIALNHASNVMGTLLPIAKVGHIARERGIMLLVDTAQTGGAYPIDMEADRIDLLAFTGHKGLGGPMGTGGLILGERFEAARLKPLKRGGTGSNSELEEQPDFLPDMYESGTPNVPGLAGLVVGVRWVLERGVEAIRSHEVTLAHALIEGLRSIPGVTVHGPLDAELQTATVSFNINGLDPARVGLHLDEEHGVMCRVGLHCSPAAHKTIGTFPEGTIRFGMSAMNTLEEIEAAAAAIAHMARDLK